MSESVHDTAERSPKLGPLERWRESMKGAWLLTAVPAVGFLLLILGEALSFPMIVTIMVVIVLWFVSFVILVRTRFLIRHSSRDVAVAFIQAVLIGTAIVVLLSASLIFVGTTGDGVAVKL